MKGCGEAWEGQNESGLVQSKIQARDTELPKMQRWDGPCWDFVLCKQGVIPEDLEEGWLLHMFLQAEWTVELRWKDSLEAVVWIQAEDKILMR